MTDAGGLDKRVPGEVESEQREVERVKLRVAVTLESISNFYGFSIDVSEGGIFVAMRDELPVGSFVDLEFRIPDVEEPFEVLGEIRWHRTVYDPEGEVFPGYGIAFMNLDDAGLEHIRNFIQTRGPMRLPER
ncbi:MAG: TIGR02266 family protein [Bradymonadaceae bacterium]